MTKTEFKKEVFEIFIKYAKWRGVKVDITEFVDKVWELKVKEV